MSSPPDPGGIAPEPPDVRRVLVVPSPDPVRLARACAGLGVRGHVVPAGGACAVVLDPESDHATAVPRLSRVLGRAPVLLLLRTDGQIGAERWTRGALADAPPAGLLLASLPDVVSTLLVGVGDAAEAEGAVRIALRPGTPSSRDGPEHDPGRPARRRRADRVVAVAVAVAVVAVLFALVEGVRAASADGSWLAVGLALFLAAGTTVLAVRRGGHDATSEPAS